MSATTLQTQARNAYKAKEYDVALTLFNRAIGRAPSVQLYDNRAACNVRLNDLPAALKDAKHAIHLGREDATGYLRAGSVLSKMEKPEVALSIYAHGLKCVRHIGAGYEQLKKMHEQALGYCAPKNSVDPMTRLPRELALQVLDYLTFRERTKVSRTSPGWMKFIMSEPRFWQDLNLSGPNSKRVHSRFVSKAINIARKKLTAATLHNLTDFDKTLFALARHCPLEKLTLDATGLRGMEFVRALEPATTLKELRILKDTEMGETILRAVMQQHQSRLEVLQVAHIKRLTSPAHWTPVLSELSRLREFNLTIGYSESGLSDILAALVAGAPLLQRLTFHQHVGGSGIGPVDLDLSGCKNLTHLDLQVLMNTASDVSFPTSLRYLKLALISGFARPEFFAQDSSQLADLANLEEAHILVPGMDFDRFTSLFDLHKHSVSGVVPSLKVLSLLRPSIPAHAMLEMPPRLHSMERLSLRECLDLTDDKLEQIMMQLPKLEVLDVRGSKITGASLKTVIYGAKRIQVEQVDGAVDGITPLEGKSMVKELILNDCADLGRDAVDWARAMGVKVTYKMTGLEKGSKKIRY
uniref:F-box domain-containing protein n=1 Tax=Ramularia collo-cygni TaxID=112498 RepID=A0A2D3UST5_9PEZI